MGEVRGRVLETSLDLLLLNSLCIHSYTQEIVTGNLGVMR